MIVVSLLLFLAGVALLAAGLVSESILLEVGSIVAALLAAMVLYLGVRQRGGVAVEDPQSAEPPQSFPPLMSTWSRTADDEVEPEPEPAVEDSADWLLEPVAPSAEQPKVAGADLQDAGLTGDEPDEESVSDADALRVSERNDDVLVIDGRPRYHLPLCPILGDDETVALPVSEAREAGFTPCARCRPDSHILSDASRSGSAR
ncbi:MAG: hypothetical protein M3O55_04195 [Actinomycetota bacterium]|nr:hypothetical protein [Actinomycetota bacterium]